MIEILKVQEIVREAAKIFSNRNAAEQIKQKGVFDYVTAIDEAVQEFIQKNFRTYIRKFNSWERKKIILILI